MKGKKLIRFDWAIKKILKNKANFSILEGFLTVVLGETVLIQEILESDSLKEDENDKFNKVDVLVKNAQGEYIIIEVQNNKEYDYFQRMLYGTSKVITQYINEGDEYAQVKKVYSITVAYFDLGQGEDYVYHGRTEFIGLHHKDKLQLAATQIELFNKSQVHQIYPEYWIIKADKFDDRISDKLDEWIYFLKNSKLPEVYTAPGLKEAGEKLDILRLSDEERKVYERYQKRLRDIASEKFTQAVDFAQALKQAKEETEKAQREIEKVQKEREKAQEEVEKVQKEREKTQEEVEKAQREREKAQEEAEKAQEEKLQIIINLIKLGLDNTTIIAATKTPIEEIEEIRNQIKD